jgi:hypothetical protein
MGCYIAGCGQYERDGHLMCTKHLDEYGLLPGPTPKDPRDARIRDLKAQLAAAKAWEDDTSDEWSRQIREAHPTQRDDAHPQYSRAMQMVSHRRSKGALVSLGVADDALAAAHEDVLTVVRGGKRDLGRTATLIDVARQSIVLANWNVRRLAGKKEGE